MHLMQTITKWNPVGRFTAGELMIEQVTIFPGKYGSKVAIGNSLSWNGDISIWKHDCVQKWNQYWTYKERGVQNE